jgi:hypothetical protein
MQKIKFISNRPWLNEDSDSCPKPIMKTIPEWIRKADRFAVNEQNGEYWEMPGLGGKIPTWKSCPAIFDIMGTGYALRTPCDIEFFLDDNQKICSKVLDPMYKDFIQERMPMPQFKSPMGYHEDHFAFFIDWGIAVPDGYSVLYSPPFNRFELPILATSGIVDNDKVNLSGTLPFFVVKGWTGVLPAGTIYSQMLPFKREHWDSEVVIEDANVMYKKNMDNAAIYRKPDGGVYQKEVWERRVYE